jgi:uncharacterized iron-regulated protein
MKLDFESMFVWIKDNRRIVLIILGLIVLLLVFGWLFSSCGRFFDWYELDGLNKNINKANVELKNLNANLRGLEIDNRLQQENINRLGVNHNEAKNGSNQAQIETNNALDNVSRVENGNFSNSSLDEANRNRCRVFNRGC